MKSYTLATAIWLRGVEVPAGSTVTLNDTSAKYFQHAFEKPKAAIVVEAPDEVIVPVEDDTDSAKLKRKPKASNDADQN